MLIEHKTHFKFVALLLLVYVLESIEQLLIQLDKSYLRN